MSSVPPDTQPQQLPQENEVNNNNVLKRMTTRVIRFVETRKWSWLDTVSNATGINRTWFLLGTGFLAFLVFLKGMKYLQFVNIIGLIYPIHAIDILLSDPDMSEAWKRKATHWLKFCVVFIFTLWFEHVLDNTLIYDFPFYELFKLLFLIWLYHPSFQGASSLYGQLVDPMRRTYREIMTSDNRATIARIAVQGVTGATTVLLSSTGKSE